MHIKGLYVEHGGADSNEFWDASFSPALLDHAGVETGNTGISVAIDAITGEVSLNEGYEARSPDGRDERLLWRTYRDMIVDGLAAEIGRGEGNDAFLDRAEAEAEGRRTRVAGVLASVADE